METKELKMTIEEIEAIELFGSKLIVFTDLGELLFRFGINLLVAFVIIRLIFSSLKNIDRKFIFTNFIINIAVFLMCILLSNIKLKIGFAFGLFAVFSILRYRTEPIPIKEMTYLFIVIVIGVINALSSKKVSYAELIFVNLSIVASIYFLETKWFNKQFLNKTIRYEKIDLIKPENYELLINDLIERTGLNIQNVDIERINFLNDTARLKIYYQENK